MSENSEACTALQLEVRMSLISQRKYSYLTDGKHL